jgi:hypothetical protein
MIALAGDRIISDNLSPRDITPLDNHVEVHLHHEWQIVEQKMFIWTMRIEASPRTIEQTRNRAPGEVAHVGSSCGRADPNRGNTIATCSVAYERT